MLSYCFLALIVPGGSIMRHVAYLWYERVSPQDMRLGNLCMRENYQQLSDEPEIGVGSVVATAVFKSVPGGSIEAAMMVRAEDSRGS